MFTSLSVSPQPNKVVKDSEFGTLLEKTFKMYQLCFSWTLLKMLHWQSELFWKTDQLLFHKHMQIFTSEPHCRRGDHTFIVRVMPENAISSEIEWERWSERKISIFYEHFPLLPLDFLWLSASNHIPSSLIPFSKIVIGKARRTFLLPHLLPVWARQQSLTTSRSTAFLLLTSVVLTSPCCSIGYLRKATHVLSIRIADDYSYACLSVGLAAYSLVIVMCAGKVGRALCSF